MPFTSYGSRELVQFVVLLVVLGLGWWWIFEFQVEFRWLAIVGVTIFGLLTLFVLSFFRDPHRNVSGDHLTIMSPADGTVTDVVVGNGECSDYINGNAHMLGIFLSVFNVHVNRSPLDGRVRYLRYKQGQYLDARHPDCGKLNEQQIIGMQSTYANNAKIVVKQIAGLIARRIVCPLRPDQVLDRGQRFGMIKFGSRTELWIDAATCDVEWTVKVGQKLKGGSSVIGILKPKKIADATTPADADTDKAKADEA